MRSGHFCSVVIPVGEERQVRIAIHAFEGVTMFHLAVPQLVFGEVTRLGLAEGWDTVLWSTGTDMITTAEGYSLGRLAGPEAAEDADLVVIPSWPYPPVAVDEPLRAVLTRAHAHGSGVVGLCMGAFAVAEAGLLGGRPAVTHWEGMDELASRHPELAVEDSVLYIDHDDVMTSAGTASSLDACLHLVRKHLGAAAANRVARSLVVAPHREGGQAQYIQRPVARPDSGDPLAATLDWAMARLHEPLSIDELAAHARMSRRTLVRRFRDTTGTTPARWVLARRLDEARSLLETTRWGVDRIALACGFGSAVTLRQNFVSAYATTPSAYRRSFALREAGGDSR